MERWSTSIFSLVVSGKRAVERRDLSWTEGHLPVPSTAGPELTHCKAPQTPGHSQVYLNPHTAASSSTPLLLFTVTPLLRLLV